MKEKYGPQKGFHSWFLNIFETADSVSNSRAFQKSALSKYASANPNKIPANPSVLSCPHLGAKFWRKNSDLAYLISQGICLVPSLVQPNPNSSAQHLLFLNQSVVNTHLFTLEGSPLVSCLLPFWSSECFISHAPNQLLLVQMNGSHCHI